MDSTVVPLRPEALCKAAAAENVEALRVAAMDRRDETPGIEPRGVLSARVRLLGRGEILPRRSALEHVDALSLAYRTARARRRPAERLIEGLRLRGPRGESSTPVATNRIT